MKSTFKLLFYINRQKIKSNGNCPIMGRITVNGQVCQYSTGAEIAPALWDATAGRVFVKGSSPEEIKRLHLINRKLNELEAKADAAYKANSTTAGYASAEVIKNAVTGKTQVKQTLIALMDEHNAEYAERTGIDRSKTRYRMYRITRQHLWKFLQCKYAVDDIPLRSLDMQFINDFSFYLLTVVKLARSTHNNYVAILHCMMYVAIKQKTIMRDPFAGCKLVRPPKNYRYLTGEQLKKIMDVELPTYGLSHTRDLFVFSAFTGLGRADLHRLTTQNLITYPDGSKWLCFARLKTDMECNIKLLDIPIAIMNKYSGEGKDDSLFNVPSTETLNNYLRQIRKICDLDCKLSYYAARHTFATQICLANEVPIETISKMMGHASVRTTQVYAELTNQKLQQDFGRLLKDNDDTYSIPQDKSGVGIYIRRKLTRKNNNATSI